MKAKHAIARIKGLAIWQKIFCVLVALTLVSLMIPNGLRANATQADNGEAQESTIETTTEGVTNDPAPTLGQAELNDLNISWPTVGSTIDFTRTSLNSDVTAGYFVKQNFDMGIQELLDIAIKYAPIWIKLLYNIDSSEIKTEEQLINAIHFLDDTAFDDFNDGRRTNFSTWMLVLLNQLATSTPVHEDFTADLDKAVWVPHIDVEDFDPGNMENRYDPVVPIPIERIFRVLNNFNSIILLDQKTEHSAQSYDGSALFMYVTLGEGSLLQQIAGTRIHVARIMPIIPMLNIQTKIENAFQSNGLKADNNVQAFFVGWELSFDGGKTFMPTTWLEKLFEKNIPAVFPVYNDSHYVLRAVFYDVEGLVQIHLDFDHAFTHGQLVSALTEDGWWSEEIIDLIHFPGDAPGSQTGGSYWTTVVPEWMPTWFVYAYIYDRYGQYILDNRTSAEIGWKGDTCCVYKDQKLANMHIQSDENIDWPEIFAGPHWVEFDNENLFGEIGKETTIKFSWYPVSPCGMVTHANISDFIPGPKGEDINHGFEVGYADVMYYNQWGMPLFRPDHALYGSLSSILKNAVTSIDLVGYIFGEIGGHSSNASVKFDTCFDQEIDHVVINAHGWTPELEELDIPYTHDMGAIYIPKRVDNDQLSLMKQDVLFNANGMLNYDVEALMQAGFAPGFPTGLDSYEVSYYEDGELLFDPFTISNFWEMQFFTMPMATGGTLAVDANGDLVNTFSAYFDYWRPWTADKLNAFGDPSQFDPTPGVSHTFQCRIHANPQPGYMVHNWNYDFLFNMGIGEVMPLTDFILSRHFISAEFVQAGNVDISATAGHSTFHMDLYNNDDPNPFGCFDFPGGTQDVYVGTKIIVCPDGTLRSVHDDSGLLIQRVETGIITAVPAEGFQLASWTINGVNYPLGTSVEAATVNADAATSIVANYVPVGGGTPVNPEDIGGGTAQTSDGMGFAFAILAMIAIAGAGVLAGRKLYNK